MKIRTILILLASVLTLSFTYSALSVNESRAGNRENVKSEPIGGIVIDEVEK